MTLRDDKAALRARVVAARAEVDAASRAQLGPQIDARLLALPEIAAARRVLLYASREAEVPMAPVAQALRARGVAIGVPRIEGDELVPCPIASWEDLVPGVFRIPTSAADPWTGPIDVVITPGAAFDEAGGRLGLGRGFYDRLLSSGRIGFAVGACWDVQLVPEVPMDALDRRVDAVVTPTRTIRT
ncbi:MAG: 5-formyltetrahydrofolate cyclo-ligase [Deltaproteobacteria bacterium]|nr:5-formyltetrahydrofolate cyclo-ligase [Deltaproteobacteria bacterium]